MAGDKRSNAKQPKRASQPRKPPAKRTEPALPPEIPPAPAVIVPPDVVNAVVEALLLGLSSYELTLWVSERFPSYSVADVLRSVGEHFVRAGQAEPVAVRGFLVEAYRNLYRKALRADRIDDARKALVQLEKIAIG